MSDHMNTAAPLVTDPVPSILPPLFRVSSITRLPASTGVRNTATLYHDRAMVNVTWDSHHVDARLHVGALVYIVWAGNPSSENGAVRIARLNLAETPTRAINLFETIPSKWLQNRGLVTRASALWESLNGPFQHLVNAIFWDNNRFHRFLVGPSSVNGHHSELTGNLRHCIETAEQCLRMGTNLPNVSHSVLVAAAFLHDAGKADEYCLKSDRSRFRLSDRGALIGHRHTILEWIAVARARERVQLPEKHYLALMHALTAAKGAGWLGIREPLSMEAMLVAAADRLSGQSDLVRQLAPHGNGFGAYHDHLKGRPYVVDEVVEIE